MDHSREACFTPRPNLVTKSQMCLNLRDFRENKLKSHIWSVILRRNSLRAGGYFDEKARDRLTTNLATEIRYYLRKPILFEVFKLLWSLDRSSPFLEDGQLLNGSRLVQVTTDCTKYCCVRAMMVLAGFDPSIVSQIGRVLVCLLH